MESKIPTRFCSYCKNEKPWIFSGKKLRDGSKIYTNEFALRWAGRRCPDCERTRVNAAVKCDGFERDIIIKQLEELGYTVNTKVLPLQAEKDGQVFSVGIRHAHAENGNITLNKAPKEKSDLYALVFSSVRICSADQLESLASKVAVYKKNHHSKSSNLNHSNVVN